MIWVPDKAGRFPKRPHYEGAELDAECERLVENLLIRRKGAVKYPLATDDLLFGLEQQATVDQYADLPSDAAGEVWGVTRFRKDVQPEVRINQRLSESARFENPFRTTISHEFSHVQFHGFLFAMLDQSPRLFDEDGRCSQTCNRQQMESLAPYDWIEWQAAYCSGAMLMPINALRKVVIGFLREHSSPVATLSASSRIGQELIELVGAQFQVSPIAAKVRLAKVGFVTESTVFQPSLLT